MISVLYSKMGYNPFEILLKCYPPYLDEEKINRKSKRKMAHLFPSWWKNIVLNNEYVCDVKWDFNALSSNPYTTFDLIHKYKLADWQWEYILSTNPHITLDIIKYHAIKNFRMLSMNPYLSFDIVLYYIERNGWDWFYISLNVAFINVEKYPNLPWDHLALSANPQITQDIIERHPEIRWNWCKLSSYCQVSLNMLEKYEKQWDWKLNAAKLRLVSDFNSQLS